MADVAGLDRRAFEHDNLRAVLGWLDRVGDRGAVLRPRLQLRARRGRVASVLRGPALGRGLPDGQRLGRPDRRRLRGDRALLLPDRRAPCLRDRGPHRTQRLLPQSAGGGTDPDRAAAVTLVAAATVSFSRYACPTNADQLDPNGACQLGCNLTSGQPRIRAVRSRRSAAVMDDGFWLEKHRSSYTHGWACGSTSGLGRFCPLRGRLGEQPLEGGDVGRQRRQRVGDVG